MINREKTQALGNHELQRQLIISYNVTWQETAVHGREMDPDGGGGGGGWGMGPSGHDTMLSQLLSGRGHAFGQGGGGGRYCFFQQHFFQQKQSPDSAKLK